MIVVCPSCQQRYRHDFDAAQMAPVAHCSACDERFELPRPKRAYVLASATAGPAAARHPVMPDRRPSTPASTGGAMAGTEDARRLDIDLPPDRDGTTAAEPSVPTGGPEPAEPKEAKAGRRRSVVLESLVALFPCGVGAGVAYHFAGPLGQDPITWAALGGATGLLLGWACLLWITRGD